MMSMPEPAVTVRREKQRANIYTVMLVLSLLFMSVACALLYLEMAQYGGDLKASGFRVSTPPPLDLDSKPAEPPAAENTAVPVEPAPPAAGDLAAPVPPDATIVAPGNATPIDPSAVPVDPAAPPVDAAPANPAPVVPTTPQ